ncbi:MAG: hypothetical protein WC889_02950 [Myxococcota bacterium]|jgi:hypothetical protein
MAYFLGQFVGGFLIVYIVAWLFERFVFSTQPPLLRAFLCVASATAICWIGYAYGSADGGQTQWLAGRIYAIPAVFVGLLFYLRFRKGWDDSDAVDLSQPPAWSKSADDDPRD